MVSYGASVEPDARQAAVLDAAVGVFARYGFRKSSMDDVARAAGVSRQGLYLHFADKESLFRRAVAHKLERQLNAATAALCNDCDPLEARLVAACDAWAGRSPDAGGTDAADLMCAGSSPAGATLSDYERRFEHVVADAVERSALGAHCTASGLSTLDVARALHATVRGLKQGCRSRQEFLRGMTAAARLFCTPLAQCASHQEL